MIVYEILTLQLPYGNCHMTDAIHFIKTGLVSPPIFLLAIIICNNNYYYYHYHYHYCDFYYLQFFFSFLNYYSSHTPTRKRPPIPPSEDGLPDADSIELYQPLIELFEKCSIVQPEQRPTAAELAEMVAKQRLVVF